MKRLSLLMLGAGLLLGCRESDDLLLVCPPDNSTAVNVFRDFVRRNAAPEQVFALTLDQPQTLETNGGARIELPANAFVRLDGVPATGRAELRVRELYTVPAMLLADMPTGDDALTKLLSGGQFKLQAWQGNVRLRMRPATSLVLTSPLPSRRNPALPADSVGMTAWSLRLPGATWVDTSQPVPVVLMAGAPFYQSRLALDSLSWWNVDRLWSTSQGSTSTVADVSFDTDGLATTFTRAWMLPTGQNGLFPTFLSSTTPGGPTNLMAVPAVPVGSRLTAVALQIRADGFYFGSQELVVQAGQRPHLTLARLSEAEIVRRIRLL